MVWSTPRSFARSGDLAASSSSRLQTCILLDAALERCGNAVPSEGAASLAPTAPCCDIELSKLAQACWSCSKPDINDAQCAAATSAADIALGMSRCTSSTPGLHFLSSSHRLAARADADDADPLYRPSPVFLGVFFAALALIGLTCLAIFLCRFRKSRTYKKRANRRAVLDLMAGSPLDEKRDINADEHDREPEKWVQFQPDLDVVSPPPAARSRRPSPTPEDMFEVPRRGSPSLPALLVTTPRHDHASVLASPGISPVPIRRY